MRWALDDLVYDRTLSFAPERRPRRSVLKFANANLTNAHLKEANLASANPSGREPDRRVCDPDAGCRLATGPGNDTAQNALLPLSVRYTTYFARR